MKRKNVLARWGHVGHLPLFVLWCLAFGAPRLSAQIEGQVLDARTRMPLIHANAYDYVSGNGTVTDSSGYFRLSTGTDSARVRISFVGYRDTVLALRLPPERPLRILLEPGELLPAAEVVARRQRAAFFAPENVEAVRLSAKEILVQPALVGEPDVQRFLGTLAGVQTGVEGQSSIFVRGGLRDQNLLLLDGAPLYYSNHLFGFLTMLNADAVGEVRFFRGGFPARYGGRLSSVIDVSSRQPSDSVWQVQGGVSLISGRVVAHGPLSPRARLLLGARRTWADLLYLSVARLQATPNQGLQRGKAFLHDYHLKLELEPARAWRLWLTAYWGQDLFDVRTRYQQVTLLPGGPQAGPVNEEGFRIGWGNRLLVLGATRRLGDSLRLGFRLAASTAPVAWGYAQGTDPETDSSQVQSRLFEASAGEYRIQLWGAWALPGHRLETGLTLARLAWSPYRHVSTRATADTAFILTEEAPAVAALQGAWYVQDNWAWGRWSGMAGLRISGMQQDSWRTAALEPRLTVRCRLTDRHALFASLTRMVQYNHLAHSMRLALPADRWLPPTPELPPQSSWLYSLNAKVWFNDTWRAEAGLWYKSMQHIVMYADGVSPLQPEADWAGQLTRGEGKAAGLELSLHTEQKEWSATANYTLSRARVHFPEKNGGKPFFHPFDRRHKLDLRMEWRIDAITRLTATWVFASGNPIVVPQYRIGSSNSYLYSPPDALRNRPYHRLDLALRRSKQKKRFVRTWVFGLYNAYSRRNTVFVGVLSAPKKGPGLYEVALFPVLPFVALDFSSLPLHRQGQ